MASSDAVKPFTSEYSPFSGGTWEHSCSDLQTQMKSEKCQGHPDQKTGVCKEWAPEMGSVGSSTLCPPALPEAYITPRPRHNLPSHRGPEKARLTADGQETVIAFSQMASAPYHHHPQLPEDAEPPS
ncbi:hypothetical protein STEG23_035654 [Scotinomys teguina]